jgi:hypothetical protein
MSEWASQLRQPAHCAYTHRTHGAWGDPPCCCGARGRRHTVSAPDTSTTPGSNPLPCTTGLCVDAYKPRGRICPQVRSGSSSACIVPVPLFTLARVPVCFAVSARRRFPHDRQEPARANTSHQRTSQPHRGSHNVQQQLRPRVGPSTSTICQWVAVGGFMWQRGSPLGASGPLPSGEADWGFTRAMHACMHVLSGKSGRSRPFCPQRPDACPRATRPSLVKLRRSKAPIVP